MLFFDGEFTMTRPRGKGLVRTVDLIVDAGDGKGRYWVNAGLLCWDNGLDIPAMARKLKADGETYRLVGGRCFVLVSEQRAERYRRLAGRILEGKRLV
jgi:hypothetical protein